MLARLSFSLFSLCLLLQSQVLFAEGPASDVPELKPLDQFVGKWEGKGPEGEKAVSETKWTLNGRFIKQEYSTGKGTKGLIMRGYSPALQKYVMTMFDSSGTAVMLLGDWDADSKTLTCTGDLGNEVVMVVKQSFPDPDTEVYSITIRVNDEVLNEFKGENHRVKLK